MCWGSTGGPRTLETVPQFLARLSVGSDLTQKERESTKKVACASLWCYKSYFHRQAREAGGRVISETQRRRWDDRVDGHEEDLGDNLSECGRVLGGVEGELKGILSFCINNPKHD